MNSSVGGTKRNDGEEIERAGAGWIEVREDGVPMLCLDTDRGTTEVYELSPEAAANLRREFIGEPSVRHDLDDQDAGDDPTPPGEDTKTREILEAVRSRWQTGPEIAQGIEWANRDSCYSYLGTLADRGLVEIDHSGSGKTTYRLTDEGQDALGRPRR